jgi:hypothetical protein
MIFGASSAHEELDSMTLVHELYRNLGRMGKHEEAILVILDTTSSLVPRRKEGFFMPFISTLQCHIKVFG